MCPLASWGQDIKPFDAKPGLWEIATTTEITGMPAMPSMPALTDEQLAKIPPAQRAQVEAAMKGRGGAGSPRTTTTKSCLTRESLSKPLFDNGDQSCTRKLVGSSAGSQQIHFECNRTNMKTTGDLNLERMDAEHVKGIMVMKAVATGNDAPPGRNMDMKVTFNTKWLASDCGDVKPAGEK